MRKGGSVTLMVCSPLVSVQAKRSQLKSLLKQNSHGNFHPSSFPRAVLSSTFLPGPAESRVLLLVWAAGWRGEGWALCHLETGIVTLPDRSQDSCSWEGKGRNGSFHRLVRVLKPGQFLDLCLPELKASGPEQAQRRLSGECTAPAQFSWGGVWYIYF